MRLDFGYCPTGRVRRDGRASDVIGESIVITGSKVVIKKLDEEVNIEMIPICYFVASRRVFGFPYQQEGCVEPIIQESSLEHGQAKL